MNNGPFVLKTYNCTCNCTVPVCYQLVFVCRITTPPHRRITTSPIPAPHPHHTRTTRYVFGETMGRLTARDIKCITAIDCEGKVFRTSPLDCNNPPKCNKR